MINIRAFESRDKAIKYPERPESPRLLRNMGSLTDEELLLVPKIREEYKTALEVYRGETQERLNRQNALVEEFHQALMIEHAMEGHPKEGKVWLLAWEDGHCGGFYEIHCHYERYADLVRD